MTNQPISRLDERVNTLTINRAANALIEALEVPESLLTARVTMGAMLSECRVIAATVVDPVSYADAEATLRIFSAFADLVDSADARRAEGVAVHG